MRIKAPRVRFAALLVAAAWAASSTPAKAQTDKLIIPAQLLAGQNPVPPEIIVPRPHSLPGDFEDQGAKDHGPRTPRFDPGKARKDAQQLAALAGKIPPEVNQLSKDQIPKDLLENLKQIQKLAKRLRSEIPH